MRAGLPTADLGAGPHRVTIGRAGPGRDSTVVLRDQPQGPAAAHRAAPVGHVELAVQRLQMHLDGVHRDEHLLGDLQVALHARK